MHIIMILFQIGIISELLADCNEKNSLNNISHMITEEKFDEKHLQSMNNLFLMQDIVG